MHEDHSADACIRNHCIAFCKTDAEAVSSGQQLYDISLERVVRAAGISGCRLYYLAAFISGFDFLQESCIKPFGCGFRQCHSHSFRHQIFIFVAACRAAAAFFVCCLEGPYADREYAEWGSAATVTTASAARQEVAQRHHPTGLLTEHRNTDGSTVSSCSDYIIPVCMSIEESCRQHDAEVSQCKLFLCILPELQEFHRFWGCASVLHSPDGIEHPPVEERQHVGCRKFGCRNVLRA